jgi:LemA protein
VLSTGLWIAIAIAVVVLIWAVAAYNGLVRLGVQGQNAWSDIDVQLKRRHDLVPNLVETVQGYAAHERETLERVVQARNQAISAASPLERSEAEHGLTQALRQLFALAEAYPDLKANQSFLQLQDQLSGIEQEIANARRYYNAVVRDYNGQIQVFPSILIASMFGFVPRPFFEAEDDEREVVPVKF